MTQIQKELIEAAVKGMREYADGIRGARHVHSVDIQGDTVIVYMVDSTMVTFEVKHVTL